MIPINTDNHNLNPLTNIDAKASIHHSVRIEPFTSIEGDVVIGAGSWIGANVVIRDGVRIGKNCRIQSGTVISADLSQLEYCHDSAPQANGQFHEVVIKDNVHIEPNSTIHGIVTIDEGCWIGSNVTIHDGARIGKNCKIFSGAVISGIPQDLKFGGERTTLEIGEGTIIRECATLNRGTSHSGKTVIGSHVLIMAYVHIAHDCVIGDHVILANAVNMGGHVEIGEYAIVGGTAAIHQFVRIGKHVMLQGGALLGKDLPPYTTAGRFPVQYDGVNIIGLRRRKFSPGTIYAIQDIYRQIFLSKMNITTALKYVENELPDTQERKDIVEFIRASSRGIIKGPK